VFLVKDNYVSPGERAERGIVRTILGEGKIPASIAKELGKPGSWVSDIMKALKDE